jgi:Ser/Thr protein kinase RdoA (MazF antagonist)
MGRRVLRQFGLSNAVMLLLRDHHNTTFDVQVQRERYLLRIGPAEQDAVVAISSEAAWLAALRRDTTLGVPQPVAASTGLLVAPATDAADGAPPRCAVLLRWQRGRFCDASLSPTHLRLAGALQAELQVHAAAWARPDWFRRPRVACLTQSARLASLTPSPVARPDTDDADCAVERVGEHLGLGHARTFGRALNRVMATVCTLESMPDAVGLIHGDLHHDNFLIHRRSIHAIDFERCGWGPRLYDLASTLHPLLGRGDYTALRDALLQGYSQRLALPEDHEDHLAALILLRRVQCLIEALESCNAPVVHPDHHSMAVRAMDHVSSALRLA